MINLFETALFSTFEFFCALICMLTIFRLPIRYHFLKIIAISIITSIITTYTFANIPDVAVFINFICLVVLFAIFYRLPFFYSVLVMSVLYLLGTILEYGTTAIVANVLHINLELGSIGLRLIYVSTGIIYLIIAWLLERKKLGFMFIARYFTMRHSVKGYNFALSAVVFASIIAAYVASLIIVNRSFNITNFYLLSLIVILFLLGMTTAYRQNKKQLKEKHERLQNR